ncbi:hypothetical protein BC830DRAFT_1234829 [Chytriomyces sp. MP71]|nr:hypothetical protein BC830DRAFT_1234829 [Chytriomyces sp. MP71]
MDTTGTMELVSCLAATTPCEASLSGGTDGEMEASSQNPFTCHQPSQVPLSQPSSQPPSKGNTPRLQASEILLALSASAPSTSPDGLTHSMGEAAAKNRKRRISASLAPYNVLESELSNASLSNQSEQGAKRPRTSSDIRPPPPSFDVNTLSSPAGSHRMHLPPPFQQQPHVLLASSSDPLPSHGRYRSFSVSSVSLPLRTS